MSFGDGRWAVTDSDGRFDAANAGDVTGFRWKIGTAPLELKRLRRRFYEPGLLVKELGYNREPLRDVRRVDTDELPPDIRLQLLPGHASRAATLSIDLVNRGGGIGRIEVYRNGQEIIPDARGRRLNPSLSRTTLKMALDRSWMTGGQIYPVRVVAWNSAGYLYSQSTRVALKR